MPTRPLRTNDRWLTFGLVGASALACVLTAISAQAAPKVVDRAGAATTLRTACALAGIDDRAAIAEFRASFALEPQPLAALGEARAHARLGEPVEGIAACRRVDEIPTAKDSSAWIAERAECAALIVDLLPKRASFHVVVRGGVPGATVSAIVDGDAVLASALGARRIVDPGVHKVTLSMTGFEDRVAYVTLAEGEIDRELVVRFPPPPIAVVVRTKHGPPRGYRMRP